MELEKINEFLFSWSKGVIDIGEIYREGGDYRKSAKLFLDTHYAFEETDVLFKPTYTTDVIFRNKVDEALSYFISGNITEDSGFAIKPWQSISSSDINFLIEDHICAVMGVLELKSEVTENITKIAFTFILKKTGQKLKIKIHHSSEISS